MQVTRIPNRYATPLLVLYVIVLFSNHFTHEFEWLRNLVRPFGTELEMSSHV